jgi:uncharacterized protein
MTDNRAREVESADIRSTLRRHLRERLIARDKRAVQAIRVAIAAIENAEAQPLDGSNQTELQLKASLSSEVTRRVVSDDDARSLVAREIDDLLTAARHYDSLGARESAIEMEEQADILRKVLSPQS